jgi:phosphohistidine phosphatase
MMLYILRHATAEDLHPGSDDGARRLTERSREKMKSAASGFKTLDLRLDAILTSPLPRASETAELVANAYNNTPAPQVLPELGAGAAPSEVVSALRPFAKLDSVMIVGHEPQLSSLASLLLTGSPAGVHLLLRKGGCIALELPARFERGGAELQWMLTHRQLRKMRK